MCKDGQHNFTPRHDTIHQYGTTISSTYLCDICVKCGSIIRRPEVK